MNWKAQAENPIEVYSNLKILCESYPMLNYNILNNYLSKSKIPYENDVVRIERKVVHTEPIKRRQIAFIGNKVKARGHDEMDRRNIIEVGVPVFGEILKR